MYCPDEKMKVNKFTSVRIPSKTEYMRRFGQTIMPSSSYTGDEEFAPLPRNKVDDIVFAEQYDKFMQQQENAKTE